MTEMFPKSPDTLDVIDKEDRQFRRSRFVTQLLIGGLLAVIVAMMVVMLMLLNAVHDTQLEGTPVGKQLLKSSQRILSCTDDQGECAKKNREATANYLKGVRDDQFKTAAAAASCAAKPGAHTYETLLACIVTTVAGDPVPVP